MRLSVRTILIAIACLCLSLSVRTIVSAQSATINADPDFDNFYTTGDGNPGVWKPYKISNPGPAIWKASTEGWPKGPSLWIYGDAIQFDGGVYQVVAVTPGHGYHFQVAWAVVRHGGVAVHDDSQLIRQVGIDPYGGTNPLSPNVQWSGEYTGSGKFAPELAIDQYAQTDHITIFLRAQNHYTDSRAEVFFDHAVLTENGAPPIAVAPPTAVPTVRPPTATPKPAAPTRTRVALVVPTSTHAPEPTDTATPPPTDTRAPTATRTPRATTTPDAPDAPLLVSRLTASIALVACLGGGGGFVLLGTLIFLFVNRSR
jgi:hypothetical protein